MSDLSRHVPLERGVRPLLRDRRSFLRTGLLAAAPATVLAAVVGGLLGGRDAAVGAGLGVLLVVAFFAASTLAIAWADAVAPELVLPVGLSAYVIKILALGVLLAIVPKGPMSHAAAVAVLVALAVWICMHVRWVWRSRLLYVADNSRSQPPQV
jgi:hypothetical protein